MSFFLLATVLLLAYSNGANDNFKGVATLFGSGTIDYRRALGWATVTTLAGSLLALLLAHGLVARFQGKGIIPDALTVEPSFLLAVSLGAALTVLVATLAGLPVSTTHALLGALFGAGAVATNGNVRLEELKSSFLIPLLVAPPAAMVLALIVYPIFRLTRRACGITRQSCICIGAVYEPVICRADGALALARTGVLIETGQMSQCFERYQGRFLGLEVGPVLDVLHYLSAGAVGFARGLNDTPKIVALLIGGEAVAPNVGLALVAIVMAVGGVLNARKVAETMSRKITSMNPGQGFTANLVTSILVTLASYFALPVSTTHVSVGALFGIGAVSGTARWRMVLTIVLAWVTTLPLGAFFGAATYWLLGQVVQATAI